MRTTTRYAAPFLSMVIALAVCGCTSSTAQMNATEASREEETSMTATYDEASIREDYHRLTKALIDHGLTITTMESATSGQIASLITDTEGASAVIKGAFVTYSNEAKIMMGVPAETIDTYSVYSEETAAAMADVCRDTYAADIGIGVTGTMGNVDPNNAEASVPGEVYYAISTDEGTQTYHISLNPQPTRLQYKLAVAEEVYISLAAMLDIE